MCPAFGRACQSVRSAAVAVTALDLSAVESKATDVLNSVEQDLKAGDLFTACCGSPDLQQ